MFCFFPFPPPVLFAPSSHFFFPLLPVSPELRAPSLSPTLSIDRPVSGFLAFPPPLPTYSPRLSVFPSRWGSVASVNSSFLLAPLFFFSPLGTFIFFFTLRTIARVVPLAFHSPGFLHLPLSPRYQISPFYIFFALPRRTSEMYSLVKGLVDLVSLAFYLSFPALFISPSFFLCWFERPVV